MKNVKFFGILLVSSMLIVGCGTKKNSDTPVTPDVPVPPAPVATDWNDIENALIEQYAYGVTIPYHHMEGNGAMFYDEQFGCLTVTGAEVTAEQLKAYSEKFTSKDGWQVEEDDLFPGTYSCTTYVTVEEDIRYVRADLYCHDKNDKIASSGTFFMDVKDPYIYSWADIGVEKILEALGSKTTLQELKADFYQVADYSQYGGASITAYNVSQKDYDEYLSYLQINWTMNIDPETMEVSYISQEEDLELSFVYKEGVASIYLRSYTPKRGDDPVDFKTIK